MWGIMTSIQSCICYQNFSNLIIYMLLVSCLTHRRFVAEGSVPTEAAKEGIKNEEKMVDVVRSHIGSRPPSCERRCSSCGHCEAVQVPIAPIVKGHTIKRHFSAYSRGDDISNYKPMSWKCKCGDFIFNP